MSVLRQQYWQGQQRVDIPHLRSIESSICADFDVLAGRIMSGQTPVVVQGFDTVTTNAVGNPASSLQVNVANATVMHNLATESGTIFWVPSTRAIETLNVSNARLKGSFTANSTNYVGIDLVRSADSTTADLVQFLNPLSNLETPKDVPLARTLDYVIYVSTQDFSTTPNICPIAIVVTDNSNNVSSVTDARNLYYRLGVGGSNPNALSTYAWPGGRTEAANNQEFATGDKAVHSMKDWMNAMMSRLWEVGGGEHWYSSTTWQNVHLLRNGTSVFVSTGDYFEWTGTNLHWQSLRVVFSNATGWFNDIANQLTDSPGLTDLADGQCIYVDLDFSTNRTGGTALAVLKGTTATLGVATNPGSRMIIAWRIGTNIFTRGNSYYIGATFNVATTSVVGTVKLHQAALTPATPIVFSDGDKDTTNGIVGLNSARAAAVAALAASNATAITGTGDGTGSGGNFIGGSNGVGLFATGNNTREGINVSGGVTGVGGAGVIAVGGGTAGIGVQGTGAGSGIGVKGQGGATGIGVQGLGGGTSAGVSGTGGSGGGAPGGTFTGGTTNGTGVVGTGTGNQAIGVQGVGGGTQGTGVVAQGGSTNGIGVAATGGGTGTGGTFQGGSGFSSAIVTKEGSGTNGAAQLVLTDNGNNAHFVFDHLGFPMGRIGMFDEEFLILAQGLTIANPIAAFGSGKWGASVTNGGTVSIVAPTTTYGGNTVALTGQAGAGDIAFYTTFPFVDVSSSFNCVVVEWDALTNGNANASGYPFVGLCTNQVGNSSGSPTGAFYAGFGMTGIWTTWTAEPVGTNTGQSATAWQRFRMEIYGTASKFGVFTVKYYINESLVATTTPATPVTNPLYFVIQINSTGASSALTVNVGGIKVRWHHTQASISTGV